MHDHRPRTTLVSVLLLATVMAAVASTGSVALGAPALPGASVQQDVQYGTADGVSLLMDVYSPTTGTSPFPAIFLVHGGGFYSGDKSQPNMVRASRILAVLGYVVFNINYRLAPEFPFPAADEDAQQAVVFARDNADRFHVDPARFGIAGSSAGSTIAAWVAFVGTGTWDTGSRVAAVVTWSGALDLLALQSELPANDPRLNPSFPSHDWLKAGSDLEQQAKAASPITYVDPTDPPMLMTNATHEWSPLEQPEAMKAKLQQAGVPSRLIVLPGTTHALNGANFFPDMLYAVLFFDKELHHGGLGALLRFNLLQPLPHGTPIVRALFWLALAAMLIWALAELVSALRARPRRT